MLFPKIHTFLKWAGPAMFGGSIAVILMFAGLAQIYPKLIKWGENLFNTWYPVVTAPCFVLLFALLIVGYIAALVYTGVEPKRELEFNLTSDENKPTTKKIISKPDLSALDHDRAEAIREIARLKSEDRPWLATIVDDIADTVRLQDLVNVIGADESGQFYLDQVRAHDAHFRTAQCVMPDSSEVEKWRNGQLRYHGGLRNAAFIALDKWLRGDDDRDAFMKSREPILELDVDEQGYSAQEIISPTGMRLKIRLYNPTVDGKVSGKTESEHIFSKEDATKRHAIFDGFNQENMGISGFDIGTINQNNSPNAVGVNLGTININQNSEPELKIVTDYGWVDYSGTVKYVVDVKITNPGATSKVRIFAPTDKITSIGFAFEGSGQTGGSGTYKNELWSDFMTPASLRRLVLSGEPSGHVPIRAEFP